MSIRIMTLAWSIPLPHADKIVLLALSDNANDEGFCYPSIATLSRKCGLEERSIHRVITRLEEGGHVTKRERPGRSTVYKVHPRDTPDRPSPLTESHPCQSVTPDGKSPLTNSQGTPDTRSPPPLTDGHTTPDRPSPITVREPSVEPSLNRNTAPRRQRSPDTATRLPDGFELTELRRQVALAERIDADREFANFRDHFRAASGQRARKHDWDAAWRVWCRRATDMQLPKSRGTASVSEESKLRRLMDNRAKCAWLQGFRDPNPGESADEYRQAQDAEFKRHQREHQGTPRFVADLATSKRLS